MKYEKYFNHFVYFGLNHFFMQNLNHYSWFWNRLKSTWQLNCFF